MSAEGRLFIVNGKLTLGSKVSLSDYGASNRGGALINEGGTLVLEGTLIHNCRIDDAIIIVRAGGTLINNGGELTNYRLNGDSGAVLVDGGTFIMNDGKISGSINTGNGGAVYIRSGIFIMENGMINGNQAYCGSGVYLSGGEFVMNGGEIGGSYMFPPNTAINGGGVYVDGGTFTMNGGSIRGNTVENRGGGIYINGGTAVINSGSITENMAANGAGAYVGSNGTSTISGGAFSDNKASRDGGGIFAEDHLRLTISPAAVFSTNTARQAYWLEDYVTTAIYDPGRPISVQDLKGLHGNTIGSHGVWSAPTERPGAARQLHYLVNNSDVNFVGSPGDLIHQGSGAEGTLTLDKTAAPGSGTDELANIWEWDVTLTLSGEDAITVTTDVVLVFDLSGSMAFGTPVSRIDAAKQAAANFVDSLITPGGKTRIAIVTFSSDAKTVVDFTNDGISLKMAINSFQVIGGTNIQAGLLCAQNLLSTSGANNKYMVLLGDGEPTFSLRSTSVTGVSAIGCSGTSHTWSVNEANVNTKEFSITFGSERVGSGATYSNGLNAANAQVYCPICGSYGGFPADNGVPAIYQAKMIKQSGISIYSIALGAGSTGELVLSECASSSSHFYSVPDDSYAGDLTDIYADIACRISNAATGAVVTDPIGGMFELVGGADGTASGITVSKGTVTFDYSIEPGTIIWDIGDVAASDGVVTMTYTVRIKTGDGNAVPGEYYSTNGYTYVDYTDVNGEYARDDFPMPSIQFQGVGGIAFTGPSVLDFGIQRMKFIPAYIALGTGLFGSGTNPDEIEDFVIHNGMGITDWHITVRSSPFSDGDNELGNSSMVFGRQRTDVPARVYEYDGNKPWDQDGTFRIGWGELIAQLEVLIDPRDDIKPECSYSSMLVWTFVIGP